MHITKCFAAAIALSLALFAPLPAAAGVGDLLVAPTRIVLNGSRGAEIVLSNIGDEVATYRISVELRRMKEDGTLEDVAAANDKEKAAQGMIFMRRGASPSPRTSRRRSASPLAPPRAWPTANIVPICCSAPCRRRGR
jgi:hypothetical protein